MEVSINLDDVAYPVVGGWGPAPGLTTRVQCENMMCDAMTGEGEFRCENRVWIDPEWVLAHQRLWPIHHPGVVCPDCAP